MSSENNNLYYYFSGALLYNTPTVPVVSYYLVDNILLFSLHREREKDIIITL